MALLFQIFDPNHDRYEVPLDLHHDSTSRSANPRYRVVVSEPGDPFSITVTRVGQTSWPPV